MPSSYNRIKGIAKNSCEAISGGVITAAITKAMTMIYRLNFLMEEREAIPVLCSITTAIGSSKAKPKDKNMCNTKLM